MRGKLPFASDKFHTKTENAFFFNREYYRRRALGSRERLDNRRPCETISFRCNGLNYTASVGRFPDGRLAEVFVSNGKAGSHSDAAARDSSITFSIACQYGADPEVIRRALCRDNQGRAGSPLGVVLDLLAQRKS
jgi:hypothetical protein